MEKTPNCFLTQTTKNLLRIVLGPDNFIYVDLTNKLPGPDIYIRSDLFATALTDGTFERAFKKPIQIRPDMTSVTSSIMREHILSLIGLANKGGYVIYGFEKIHQNKDQIKILFQARNGSEAEKKRLNSGMKSAIIYGNFESDELGYIVGRDLCIHLGIKAGHFAETIQNQMETYSLFLEGLKK